MEIIETDKYGLANTISGIIYLHPILNEFPLIKEKVIKHEIEHTKTKGFWKQRKIDALTKLKFRDLSPIYKRKPSLFFKQYSPITYKDKTLYFEWSLIFLYSFYLGVGTLIFWIIKTFSKNSTIFFKIIQYFFIILFIIGIIYLGGKKLIKYINEQAKKPS